MTSRHNPQQQFHHACQIAKDHGMFVVDKGDRFVVYRKTPVRISAWASAAAPSRCSAR